MPGTTDVWNRVRFPSLTPAGDTAETATEPQLSPTASLRSRLTGSSDSGRARLRLVAALSAALVLATGTAVTAQAHKTVTLDVDGVETRVTTFAGSVEGLLEEHDVTVGTRDTVAPDGALQDGSDVVVRHARLVTVRTDGVDESVWTTALSADEALEALAGRGGDVQLVASRSNGTGRPFLAGDLTLDGPADVLRDGETLPVPDGVTDVATALERLGVVLGERDTVAVRPGADGRVTVVVTRVVVQDVTTTVELPFASVTQDDAGRFVGQKAVVTEGVAGVRTVVERVTTVDGVETAREPVSDQVTQAPVDEVVAVGSKPRPAPTPKAAAAPAAESAPATGSPVTAGGDADSLNWAALAKCESGGNPSIVSATGKYHGLYQFSVATWQAVGGAGLPSDASAEEQTARAKMLYNRSGAGQWPHCGKNLFS
ncbi:resuscitation-promoting factor [Cellulomonas cellasea]|uniref:resuscitation-promoting factor n=1 Tax=Cellulomonas cellasea TaxID=43670 RepID=UPI000558B6E7|nr:resuscitation-promoting factor [Cellulomonas cellasea]